MIGRLREQSEAAPAPVIFLTGRAGAVDVAEGLQRGAFDYLRKPFEGPELVARVNAAVRTSRLQEELRERNAQLERMAYTDTLTGIANRRSLDDQLRRSISRARRHHGLLAIALFDIDHFKQVNDRHGHDAGDAVLVAVAERVPACARLEDVVGRWGGEEFLLVAPDTGSAGIRALAERLRRALATEPVAHGGEPIAVTASFGWATWRDETVEALVSRADAALYEAKQAGRNAVRGLA